MTNDERMTNLQHVNVKIFVAGDLAVDLERFIEVFHRWTAEQLMAELLIDVADYRHVPHGPGVVLVGHEADYALDNAGGRFGLLYNRKAPLEGTNADRFRQALRSAAHACELLETEFADAGPLQFSRQEFELFINDRAIAPNTAETFAACKADLEAFLQTTLGHDDFTIDHQSDPRRRFGVAVTSSQPLDFGTFHQ
jgi:hypothetical protein